jgi:3-oxoacyl-[acyl-carrier-protein] synthase-3
MAAYIRRIEYSLPKRVVTNQNLKNENPDWNMNLTFSKTGVASRHFASEGELASDLAFAAATTLISAEGLKKEEIDALIVCTQSPDYVMPSNSALLQTRLGLPVYTAAFDFNLACSGFIYGLALCKSLLAGMDYRRALLLTADTYSKYIHPKDRSALTLFGDGAAATLVESGTSGSSQIIDALLATNGDGADKFIVKAGGLRYPKTANTCVPKRDLTGNIRTDENIYMDGGGVLEFVKRDIPGCVDKILQRNKIALKDVRLVIFHQASKYAMDVLNDLLELSPEQTFSNIENIGNTVSASIPIALKDAEEQGRMGRGDLVLLVGFGVGFSFGATLLRW